MHAVGVYSNIRHSQHRRRTPPRGACRTWIQSSLYLTLLRDRRADTYAIACFSKHSPRTYALSHHLCRLAVESNQQRSCLHARRLCSTSWGRCPNDSSLQHVLHSHTQLLRRYGHRVLGPPAYCTMVVWREEELDSNENATKIC